MSPGQALGSSVDEICGDLSTKITLTDIGDERKLRAKAKRCLVKLLRRNAPLDQLRFPSKIWALLQKHLPLAKLSASEGENGNKKKEEDEAEEEKRGELIERSPIRSPRRSPDHQSSYAPYGRNHRGQDNCDAPVQAFLHELQQDPDMMRDFTEFCESLPTDLPESDESSDNFTQSSNGCYQNNQQNELSWQWETARCDIQNGGPRSTRYSFSSSASTSSGSPGPPLSSSPPSPAPSNYSSDYGVREITETWMRTTMNPQMSPTGSHSSDMSIPATVSDLAWDYPSSNSSDSYPASASPGLSDDSERTDERSYHELRTPARKATISNVRNKNARLQDTPLKRRLHALLNPAEKESAWSRIQQLPLEKLAEGDAEGDTQLMILLANPHEKQELYVYNIVERLVKEAQTCLGVTNRQGKDALRIATEDCADKPLLVGYLAEAYLRAGVAFKEYNDNQESLVHIAAKLGDKYAAVLQQLLSLRNGSEPALDVNRQDSTGHTALHAVFKAHSAANSCTLNTKLLLQAGANLLIQDYLNRNTPLHVLIQHSCDIKIVRAVRAHLKAQQQLSLSADSVNRQNNTVLHLACAKNSLPLPQHKMLVETLVSFGGRVHLKNVNGHVPSYLVDAARKEEMRPILHGKPATNEEKPVTSGSADSTPFA